LSRTHKGNAVNYLISRRDNPETQRMVSAAELLAACERLSEEGRHPLDVVAVGGGGAAPEALTQGLVSGSMPRCDLRS
jgi:hypothetical protein